MANSLVHETHSKGYHNPSESCPALEKPPLNTDLDNLTGSKQAKPESKEEVADHAQTHLNKKEQELNDFRQAKAELEWKVQELNESKNLSEADLHKKGEEFEEIRKLWKEACIKLNNLKIKGQGFCAVTDSMLIQKATQLRFNIRNFADQQFGGEFIDVKNFQLFQKTTIKYIRISSDSLEACMKDPSGPPIIVGVVLWKILVADVFDNFCWAGEQASNAMYSLGNILEPVGSGTLASDLEAKRKFQIWKANTTTLFLDSSGQRDGHEASRKFIEGHVCYIYGLLKPLLKSNSDDLTTHLLNIINEALNLDKLICKQAAEVTWDSTIKNSGQFDQDLVKLQRRKKQGGGKQAGNSGDVYLVSAPAMIRCGKSTGEEFDSKITLLKMEVFSWPTTIHFSRGLV